MAASIEVWPVGEFRRGTDKHWSLTEYMGTIPHWGVQVPLSKEVIPYTVSSPVIHEGYNDEKIINNSHYFINL